MIASAQDGVTSRYVLNQPAQAIRYRKGVNATAVGELVRAARPGSSFSNLLGPLMFSNGGPSFEVADGEWVVVIGGKILTFNDEEFLAHFSKA